MNAALREAEFGNASQARKATSSALAQASTRDAQILAALALARAGASFEAQEMAEDLEKRFPRDTLINLYWLPTINADCQRAVVGHGAFSTRANGALLRVHAAVARKST